MPTSDQNVSGADFDILSPSQHTPNKYKDLMNRIGLDVINGGIGGTDVNDVIRGLDRHKVNALPMYMDYSGFTFITRPELCLVNGSIMEDPVLAPMMSEDPGSTSFLLKCLLDPQWVRNHTSLVSACPRFDRGNPFVPMLCNNLTSMSGWPDYKVETETTEGGFFGDDQTLVKGSDENRKSYDFTLEFREIDGGLISALMQMWTKYQSNVALGRSIAYGTQIDEVYANYTCSIYRFLTDPTRKRITKWARAMGTYPVGNPLGAMMNINEGENYIANTGKFSINFTVNDVAYNDYKSLLDFNRTVYNFNNDIESWDVIPDAGENFKGIPYIVSTPRGYEIEFRSNR